MHFIRKNSRGHAVSELAIIPPLKEWAFSLVHSVMKKLTQKSIFTKKRVAD